MALANGIPKFDILIDVIGALLIVPMSFVIPLAFSIVHQRSASKVSIIGGLAIPTWATLIFIMAIWIVSTISTVAGVISSESEGKGAAFACHALQQEM